MKRIQNHIAAVLAAVLAISSCEEPLLLPEESEGGNSTPEKVFVNAEVSGVGLTEFVVDVTTSVATPYYIACYKEEDFYGVTMENIAADLRRKAELGIAWSTVLKVGSETIVFNSLISDTPYKVIVFGINAEGTTTTDPIILDVRTEKFSAEAKLVGSTPFDYEVEVTTNRDDIGWYGVAFMGSESRLSTISDELLMNYIRYYLGSDSSEGMTYEEITTAGTGTFKGECYPDDVILFTAVAVDKHFRVVSGITRLMIKPSQEGLSVFDEKRTEHIHALIYAYNHEELGVLLDFPSYDKSYPGYPTNTISFNGDSEYYYGVDFYTATDKQAADFLAWSVQDEFNAAIKDPQYAPYFAECSTPEEYMSLIWYDTSKFVDNGKIWNRIPAADIISYLGGEQPDQIAFAVSINGINKNLKISPIEYLVCRCSFSEEGYTFNTAAPARHEVRSELSSQVPGRTQVSRKPGCRPSSRTRIRI